MLKRCNILLRQAEPNRIFYNFKFLTILYQFYFLDFLLCFFSKLSVLGVEWKKAKTSSLLGELGKSKSQNDP